MISTKIIAIAMAVIVVAGGVTAVAIYNNNKSTGDDDSDSVTIKPADLSKLASATLSPKLEVYGNVNGDLVIDSADATALQAALDAGTQNQLGDYADANFDGTINADDVTYINQIINATVESPVLVRHLCRYTGTGGNYYNDSYVPLNSIVMSGSANMFMMMKYLGVTTEIKGIAYSGKIDATLYPEYQTFFSDFESTKATGFWKNAHVASTPTYRIGGSAGYFNAELTSNMVTYQGVKAIFTCDNASSYLNGSNDSNGGCLTESEAKAAPYGLGVFRFKAASTDMTEYLSDLALMAFALNKDPSKISNMKTWCENFLTDLNGKLTAHLGVDTNQLNVAVTSSVSYSVKNNVVSTYNYISSSTSDYTAAAISAGGLFALSDYDFKGSSSSTKQTDSGLWLADYTIDKIIHIKTAATTGTVFSWYGGTAKTDGKETLKIAPLALSKTSACYNNNIYMVCGDMPIILRIAYCAVVLYPEIFSDSWATDYNVSHSTQFLGMDENTIRNGTFYVSMSDLGLDGKTMV